MTIYMTEDEFWEHEYKGSQIASGGRYAIVEYTNLNTNAHWYKLYAGVTEGIGGNQDSAIKRWHGWRGTTNNIYAYAHGLREVLKITEFKNGNYRITLGEDLKAGEP